MCGKFGIVAHADKLGWCSMDMDGFHRLVVVEKTCQNCEHCINLEGDSQAIGCLLSGKIKDSNDLCSFHEVEE